MLSFLGSVYIFYGLMVLSSLACAVLFLAHQKVRQNLILRICCIWILLMHLVIVGGHIKYDGFASVDVDFCEVQAVTLNYFYICIHAFACFMMLNNCYIAFGWRLSIFDNKLDREWTFVLLAISIPLLSVLAVVVILSDQVVKPQVIAGPFFCSISRPRFEASIFWFILFAVPGAWLSLFLLYKTFRARKRTLLFGSTTQIGVYYLLRLTISTFLYLVLAFGSAIPLILIKDIPTPITNTDPAFLPAEVLRSPWTNMNLCVADYSKDPLMKYFQRVSCPGALSYFPVITGIMCFLMYGFGFHAREAYRRFFASLKGLWRRQSSGGRGPPLGQKGQMPSIDEDLSGEDGEDMYSRPPSPFCISFPTPEMEQRAMEM